MEGGDRGVGWRVGVSEGRRFLHTLLGRGRAVGEVGLERQILGSEPRVCEDLGDGEPLRGILLQDVLDQIARLCSLSACAMLRGCYAAPNDSHAGSSNSPRMIMSRITPSSSSSKGRVPVSRV